MFSWSQVWEWFVGSPRCPRGSWSSVRWARCRCNEPITMLNTPGQVAVKQHAAGLHQVKSAVNWWHRAGDRGSRWPCPRCCPRSRWKRTRRRICPLALKAFGVLERERFPGSELDRWADQPAHIGGVGAGTRWSGHTSRSEHPRATPGGALGQVVPAIQVDVHVVQHGAGILVHRGTAAAGRVRRLVQRGPSSVHFRWSSGCSCQSRCTAPPRPRSSCCPAPPAGPAKSA